jgi:hypothetical protein
MTRLLLIKILSTPRSPALPTKTTRLPLTITTKIPPTQMDTGTNDGAVSDNGHECNSQDPPRSDEEDEPLSNDGEQGSDDDNKSNSSNGPRDTESDRESVRFTLIVDGIKLNITMTRTRILGIGRQQ